MVDPAVAHDVHGHLHAVLPRPVRGAAQLPVGDRDDPVVLGAGVGAFDPGGAVAEGPVQEHLDSPHAGLAGAVGVGEGGQRVVAPDEEDRGLRPVSLVDGRAGHGQRLVHEVAVEVVDGHQTELEEVLAQACQAAGDLGGVGCRLDAVDEVDRGGLLEDPGGFTARVTDDANA